MRIVVEGDVTPQKLAETARHMATYLGENEIDKLQRVTIDLALGEKRSAAFQRGVTPSGLKTFLEQKELGIHVRSAELGKMRRAHVTPAFLGLLAFLVGAIFLGFLGKIGFF
ncbi:MAG: hypothetical protein ACK5O7_03585 [Holosporales bacterium]